MYMPMLMLMPMLPEKAGKPYVARAGGEWLGKTKLVHRLMVTGQYTTTANTAPGWRPCNGYGAPLASEKAEGRELHAPLNPPPRQGVQGAGISRPCPVCKGEVQQ